MCVSVILQEKDQWPNKRGNSEGVIYLLILNAQH